jgi:molecular chaperone DnaK (HSP70)
MNEQANRADWDGFIGIDFGTTKTMVASYDPVKKSAKPLTLGRGKFEKPSSMYTTETGESLFGDDADDEGITDLPNHIRRFKMKLGKPGPAHVGRRAGTALQLTTEFLENIRGQLQNQVLHTSVDRVILTVPAMFGPAQRHDLTAAARQAGFSQVELLEEPVAAGIAYCDHQSDISKQLRFIVVDWGGGTFDVAHVERSLSGEIKVHDDFVVGLDDIGGEVFDDELWGIASSALESAGHGALQSQAREDWGRFRRDLSLAKERLSSQTSVSMTFTLSDGKSAKVTLNRADFNAIISPMVQRAASLVSQLITRSQINGCPPEFILLAGGTSRIPFVGEELERITGIKCRQWNDGREAIALGAAIRANQMWGQQENLQQREADWAGMCEDGGMSKNKELSKDSSHVGEGRVALKPSEVSGGNATSEPMSLEDKVILSAVSLVVGVVLMIATGGSLAVVVIILWVVIARELFIKKEEKS